MLPPLRYPIVFLRTRDIQKTRSFYEKIIGLELVLDQGGCQIFRIGRDGYWGFCQGGRDIPSNPESICLTLVVDTPSDVDAWHEWLIKNGVVCIRPPQHTPKYKIYNAFYSDPDGYTLEVQAFYPEGKPKGA